MAILDSIQEARKRGASDDLIIQEIRRQNPDKSSSFDEAQKRGASSTQVVEEILKQNQSKRQSSTLLPVLFLSLP
ncbi:MAG: hypothetical protein IH991_00500 [Planctomycetes bacterium]|nr:hypothetical protein [Planctomycetota bacterium]